jgi:hypothetical protein
MRAAPLNPATPSAHDNYVPLGDKSAAKPQSSWRGRLPLPLAGFAFLFFAIACGGNPGWTTVSGVPATYLIGGWPATYTLSPGEVCLSTNPAVQGCPPLAPTKSITCPSKQECKTVTRHYDSYSSRTSKTSCVPTELCGMLITVSSYSNVDCYGTPVKTTKYDSQCNNGVKAGGTCGAAFLDTFGNPQCTGTPSRNYISSQCVRAGDAYTKTTCTGDGGFNPYDTVTCKSTGVCDTGDKCTEGKPQPANVGTLTACIKFPSSLNGACPTWWQGQALPNHIDCSSLMSKRYSAGVMAVMAALFSAVAIVCMAMPAAGVHHKSVPPITIVLLALATLWGLVSMSVWVAMLAQINTSMSANGIPDLTDDDDDYSGPGGDGTRHVDIAIGGGFVLVVLGWLLTAVACVLSLCSTSTTASTKHAAAPPSWQPAAALSPSLPRCPHCDATTTVATATFCQQCGKSITSAAVTA